MEYFSIIKLEPQSNFWLWEIKVDLSWSCLHMIAPFPTPPCQVTGDLGESESQILFTWEENTKQKQITIYYYTH